MGAKGNWGHRHPRTHRDKRWNCAHREFIRAKRSVKNLVDCYSGFVSSVKYSKSWKSRYKCRKQWMRENKHENNEWDNPRELAERLQTLTGLNFDECYEALLNTAKTWTDWDNNESAPYYDYDSAVEYIEEKYKLLLLILRG